MAQYIHETYIQYKLRDKISGSPGFSEYYFIYMVETSFLEKNYYLIQGVLPTCKLLPSYMRLYDWEKSVGKL